MLSSIVLALATTVSCIDPKWTKVDGKLKKVQASNDFETVCGVSFADDIFCTSTSNFAWYQLPGKLIDISVANGRLFGVGTDGKIYHSLSTAKGQAAFNLLPGGASQIDFDGQTVCHTNGKFEIYCADENVAVNPNWFQVPGSLKQVVVHGTKLFGVTVNNELAFSPSVRNAVWSRMPGILSQIHFDGANLCGVNDNGSVFCAAQKNEALLGNDPQWELIPGILAGVSTGVNGRIIGAQSNGDVYVGSLKYAPPQARK